jgi:hypothetical protein
VWYSFRSENDRLFERFGFPSLRRVFDTEPSWRPTAHSNFSTLAIEGIQHLAGVAGHRCQGHRRVGIQRHAVAEGQKRQEKGEKDRIITSPSARTACPNERFSFPPASIVTRSRTISRTGPNDHAAENSGGPAASEENRS